MKIETIPISEIIPYSKNPRKNEGAVDVVAKSIKEFGFKNPIILDKNNEIIAGHTRLKAAKKLALQEVPVIWADDLTSEQVKAFRIMDNKSSEFAEWDMELLKTEFQDLDSLEYDLDLTGFDLSEVAEIWDDKKPKEDDFEIPKEAKYKIEQGEIWQLGDHRLMCGDSTKKEDVDTLMDENKADMVFTDPPYNLGFKYNDYRDNQPKIEYSSWCKNWFLKVKEISNKIIITTGKQNIALWCLIENPEDIAVWIHKNGVSGGKVSNLSLWEPLFFYGKFDRNSRPNNLFEYNLKRQNIGTTGKEHSCPKQIDLIADIVESYSKRKESILDIFGGSGTTLIACEQLKRKCFMMEIDPFYCSVILERWEKLTKKEARKL